jgi:hypothetical protein
MFLIRGKVWQLIDEQLYFSGRFIIVFENISIASWLFLRRVICIIDHAHKIPCIFQDLYLLLIQKTKYTKNYWSAAWKGSNEAWTLRFTCWYSSIQFQWHTPLNLLGFLKHIHIVKIINLNFFKNLNDPIRQI